ncbi:MAG: DNA replication/repair protein RecF [Steroidobacteraceae bacterium]
MTLRSLQVTDFRCLQRVELQPDPDFTFIWGANASGKTSLLEAIYFLGRGRSFRTRLLNHLPRRGTSRFVLFGEAEREGRDIPLGIEGGEDGLRARIEGRNAASLAELTLALPTQIIDPEVHKLIEEGPGRRRRFLDWGVFHVEPSFVGHWQRYQQALRQRNAALRQRQPRSVVSVWDPELVHHGEAMAVARGRYVEQLIPHASRLGRNLLEREITLNLRPGWSGDSLQEALHRSWDADRERGSTGVGPQRAELKVLIDGVLARDDVSRGQQKLLASALLLAQLRLFGAESSAKPLLLLDDPAAELDEHRLARLIEEVRGPEVQLIVTSLSESVEVLGRPGLKLRIEQGALVGP